MSTRDGRVRRRADGMSEILPARQRRAAIDPSAATLAALFVALGAYVTALAPAFVVAAAALGAVAYERRRASRRCAEQRAPVTLLRPTGTGDR